MRITVTTTSQTLDDILTTQQKEIVNPSGSQNEFDVELQNLGNDAIYLEFDAPAVAGQTTSISNSETVSFSIESLAQLNLIAAVENNSVNLAIK